MTSVAKHTLPSLPSSPATAVFWDESHLWAVLLIRFLERLNLHYVIAQGHQIAKGFLEEKGIRLLIVPGGWAAQKHRTLGTEGAAAIRQFISRGGRYLGFCGGAGLALDNGGLGLSKWQRKPLEQRLPNCSGHVLLDLDLPANFQDLPSRITAPVWWPSQFQYKRDRTKILAKYDQPGHDFWVADLPLRYLSAELLQEFEKLYQINLDFSWLRGQPAIIQGRFGRGEYILSYAHLESPGSEEANQFLTCILEYLLSEKIQLQSELNPWDLKKEPATWPRNDLLKARSRLMELIALGEENFLLCWRKTWLLGWKRGMPGLHLNGLLALVQQVLSLPPNARGDHFWACQGKNFLQNFEKFCTLFQELIFAMRLHMAKFGPLSPVTGQDQACTELRKKLIGRFPGQGGLTQDLQDILSRLLLLLLTTHKTGEQ